MTATGPYGWQRELVQFISVSGSFSQSHAKTHDIQIWKKKVAIIFFPKT